MRARRPPPAAGGARSIPRADANLAADADGGGARGRQGSRHDQRGARRVARGGAAAARRAAARRFAPPRICAAAAARLRNRRRLANSRRRALRRWCLARCARPRSTSRRSPRCTSTAGGPRAFECLRAAAALRRPAARAPRLRAALAAWVGVAWRHGATGAWRAPAARPRTSRGGACTAACATAPRRGGGGRRRARWRAAAARPAARRRCGRRRGSQRRGCSRRGTI